MGKRRSRNWNEKKGCIWSSNANICLLPFFLDSDKYTNRFYPQIVSNSPKETRGEKNPLSAQPVSSERVFIIVFGFCSFVHKMSPHRTFGTNEWKKI